MTVEPPDRVTVPPSSSLKSGYCTQQVPNGICGRLLPCVDHPERPKTEPRWALLMFPYLDDTNMKGGTIDPLGVQLVFDYAQIQGFDQRRAYLSGLPKEAWGRIPTGAMVIEQLGTGNERPQYTIEQVVAAYEDAQRADYEDNGTFLRIPKRGDPGYELYRIIFNRTILAVREAAASLENIRRWIFTLGVGKP
jgi:hypothetical protein